MAGNRFRYNYLSDRFEHCAREATASARFVRLTAAMNDAITGKWRALFTQKQWQHVRRVDCSLTR